MDAKKWIKWEDFDEDGENGKWCIGTEDSNRVIAATVEATEQEADLIAAAPDLLAALEEAVKLFGCGVDDANSWEVEARAAIARAKGQTEEDNLERARR